MTNDNSNTFGILDLFALMTLCALAMAFATPFIQSLGKEPSRNLLLILGLQLIFFIGAFGMSLASRQKALRIAGAKLFLATSPPDNKAASTQFEARS